MKIQARGLDKCKTFIIFSILCEFRNVACIMASSEVNMLALGILGIKTPGES